jgi:prolipoprotein diacylglyceryltransferase
MEFIAIIVWIFIIWATYALADSKWYSGVISLLFWFLFSIFRLLFYLILPKTEEKRKEEFLQQKEWEKEYEWKERIKYSS